MVIRFLIQPARNIQNWKVRYIVIPSTATVLQCISTGFGNLFTNLTAGDSTGYNFALPTTVNLAGGATAIVYLSAFVGILADTTYTLSISLTGVVQTDALVRVTI
jgi:hypothetical protein